MKPADLEPGTRPAPPAPEDTSRTTLGVALRDALGFPEAELREHLTAMRDLARRLLGDGQHAEDVVNDAFLVACSKEKSQRPDQKNQSENRAWLCGLVRMAVMTYRYRAARNGEPMLLDQVEALSSASRHWPLVEERCMLAKVLHTLPLYERGLLLRHVVEGLSIQEIADEDAAPRSSVSSAYHRSLAKLRELLAIAALVLLLLVREARAHAAALRARLASSFARSPMRHLASAAAGAVVMGAMPHPHAEGLPGNFSVANTATMDSVVLTIQPQQADPAPTTAPNTRGSSSARPAQDVSIERDRSAFDIMAGSARRRRTNKFGDIPR